MNYSSANIRMWSRLGPSGVLGAAALELGEAYENLAILSADMTFAAGLERFRAKYSDKFYNVGIAEQNLVGVAAGMAREGLLPYAVTYATFLSMRAADQVKVCLGYMKQNVKLIGILGGLSAGILGPTHISIEDIAVMRAIPNMIVLSPADGVETAQCIIAAAQREDPIYIRLTGTMNMPIVYQEAGNLEIGKARYLREGSDVSIMATGSMVFQALRASEILEEQGISCQVLDIHTIKPLDSKATENAANHGLVVTVEEHSVLGGLGGAVAELLSGIPKSAPLLRLGVQDWYCMAGSYQSQLEEYRLTPQQIAVDIQRKWDALRNNC